MKGYIYKKIKVILYLLICILLASGITPVFANNFSKKYILNNISLSDDLKFKVEAILKNSNKTINERGLDIDPVSKEAYEIYGFRSTNGKNYTGLSWNWNYVRIYLDSKISAIKVVVSYISVSYPNGIYIDLNYFGLASCGIGSFTGGVFGIIAAVPISILLSWQVNACGLSFGSQ